MRCFVLLGYQPFNPPLCSAFYWSANYNSSYSFSALLLIIEAPIFGARQRKLVHGKYHRHPLWVLLSIFSGQKKPRKVELSEFYSLHLPPIRYMIFL